MQGGLAPMMCTTTIHMMHKCAVLVIVHLLGNMDKCSDITR